MFFSAANNHIRILYFFAAFLIIYLSACTTVKNAPANKPFVYETTVSLPPNFDRKEKKELELQLLQQLHDSIKVRSVRKFFIIRNWIPRFFATEIVNPPVYDSLNAEKSIGFMRAYLNTLGYYRDSITYDDTIKNKNNDLRTHVHFRVVNAQMFRFDSISYNLLQDTSDGSLQNALSRQKLQEITNNSLQLSAVKKGAPFSQSVLSTEINRLTDEYRNNGFLKFSSEEFIVLWDTVGIALIRPTLDPIEQARQLEELRRRRQNPTTDIEFRLRTTEDTTRLIQYHVGKIRVFPDLTADADSFEASIDTVKGYEFISYRNLFKPKKLVDYIYLKQGDLYRQSNYLRTQNRFSSLNSWRLVTITPYPRLGQDTVDFDIKLTPANRYLFTANLEASRNLTPLVPTGSLIGVGAVVSIHNRNFLRAANQFTNNFRYGVELNATSNQSAVQTMQFSYSGTIQFPRRVPGRLPRLLDSKENVRTLLGVNFAYTNRLNYFTVQTINLSWGYERSFKNLLLNVRFPNIEYNFLRRGELLKQLIDSNRSFNYIFNRGLILSTIGTVNYAFGKRRNISNLLTISTELSGLVASSIIKNKIGSNPLYRFIRFDTEFRHTKNIRRSALAFRAFAGIGIPLAIHGLDSANFYLPFFRQYVAGGPNSMRAWGIRRLGPGSSIRSFNTNKAPDRFGDIRLEINGEYRFYIANISSFTLNGALFADIGNVWFNRKNPDFPNGELRFDRLWQDIAIGTGTGLRIDFNFLKLRFDYAFKVKNPTPDEADRAEQNQWFYKWQLLGGQLQFGIDYPF